MYEQFGVEEISLDEINPRLELPAHGDRIAIQELIADNAKRLMALVEHISRTGTLDPSNPPIVLRNSDGTAIVLEGNRRVAALKLLRDPSLAPTEELRSRIVSLVEKHSDEFGGGKGPSGIWCYVVASREDARQWIELRHTGVNGGVGTAPWNAYQKNTWKRDPGTQADRAWVLIRFLLEHYARDPSFIDDVRAARDSTLTTVGRLFADPEVRKTIGLDYRGDAIEFTRSEDQVLPVLRRIFADFRAGLAVDVIKNPKLRANYLQTLRDVLPSTIPDPLDFDQQGDALATDHVSAVQPVASPSFPASTSDSRRAGQGAPQEIPDQQVEASAAQPSTPSLGVVGASSMSSEHQLVESPSVESRPGRINNPAEERVLFSGLRMPNADVAVRRLLKEAQDIPIVDAPNVCGVLLRVIVELAVTELVQVANLRPGKQTLKELIRVSLLHLDPLCHDEKNRNATLHLAWVRSQDDGALSVRTMQDYVHHLSVDALITDVRNLSKTYRRMLELIDAELGKLKPRP